VPLSSRILGSGAVSMVSNLSKLLPCEFEDLQASARKSWSERMADRNNHEDHGGELGVERLQLGPELPTQEGDANGAGEANHSGSANADSEAQDEEHENQGAENE
jgi:hypothetical protein